MRGRKPSDAQCDYLEALRVESGTHWIKNTTIASCKKRGWVVYQRRDDDRGGYNRLTPSGLAALCKASEREVPQGLPDVFTTKLPKLGRVLLERTEDGYTLARCMGSSIDHSHWHVYYEDLEVEVEVHVKIKPRCQECGDPIPENVLADISTRYCSPFCANGEPKNEDGE
jgi:hypothetical protein